VTIKKQSPSKTEVRFRVLMIRTVKTVPGKRSRRTLFLGSYGSHAEAEGIKIRALELIEGEALTGEEVRNTLNSEAAGTRKFRQRLIQNTASEWTVYNHKASCLNKNGKQQYGVQMKKKVTVDGKENEPSIFLGYYASQAEAEAIKIRALELFEVTALTGEEVRSKIISEAAGTRTCRLRNNRSSVQHLYDHQQELVNNRTFHVTNL
jgi:hypothetical protein